MAKRKKTEEDAIFEKGIEIEKLISKSMSGSLEELQIISTILESKANIIKHQMDVLTMKKIADEFREKYDGERVPVAKHLKCSAEQLASIYADDHKIICGTIMSSEPIHYVVERRASDGRRMFIYVEILTDSDTVNLSVCGPNPNAYIKEILELVHDEKFTENFKWTIHSVEYNKTKNLISYKISWKEDINPYEVLAQNNMDYSNFRCYNF